MATPVLLFFLTEKNYYSGYECTLEGIFDSKSTDLKQKNMKEK